MSALISVVVPTYNRGAQVAATLDSVLSQTYTPIELIVVDDGSTDDTAAFVAAHYGEKVRLLVQKNGGVASTRNRGLEEARGEFIAFLDHDDLWLPRHLQNCLETFEARPEVAVVFARWQHLDEQGKPIPPARTMTMNPVRLPQPGRAHHWICRMPCQIISMSVAVIRTQKLREIGGFDAQTAPADDWDLWLRMGKKNDFCQVQNEEITVNYVVHGAQQSSQFERMKRGIFAVIAKQKKSWQEHPSRLPFLWAFAGYFHTIQHYHEAKNLASQRRFGKAWAEFGRALFKAPIVLFSKQWLYLAKRLISRDSRPF